MAASGRLQTRTFTDYPPRHQQDLGHMYSSLQHGAMQPYHSQGGLNFVANASYIQYSTVSPSYSPYSSSYTPSSGSSSAGPLFAYHGNNSLPYSVQPPPRGATLPSQHKVLPRSYSSPNTSSASYTNQHYAGAMMEARSLLDTEEQDSVNRDSGQSEPMDPPLDGYPDVRDFDELMKNYVSQLSPKKQDKALINARRAANIRYVLANKKTTNVESAQFRFWVKKMFQLHPNTGGVSMDKRRICHENKPIAVREKLFKILTKAHHKCSHGGRDKTSAQVRKVYSWVPKELISRFVKLCPTCRERRGAVNSAEDNKSSSELQADSMKSLSNETKPVLDDGRGNRSVGGESANITDLPSQLMNASTTFQNQNRWLSGFPPLRSTYESPYTTEPVFSEPGSYRDLEHSVDSPHLHFSSSGSGPESRDPESSCAMPPKQEASYEYK